NSHRRRDGPSQRRRRRPCRRHAHGRCGRLCGLHAAPVRAQRGFRPSGTRPPAPCDHLRRTVARLRPGLSDRFAAATSRAVARRRDCNYHSPTCNGNTPFMLRRLYDWTMSLARTRHAEKGLAGVSFIESSVFPIPPDVLLIPMVLADRPKWLRLAFVCTVASVLGALLGYVIGAFL